MIMPRNVFKIIHGEKKYQHNFNIMIYDASLRLWINYSLIIQNSMPTCILVIFKQNTSLTKSGEDSCSFPPKTITMSI